MIWRGMRIRIRRGADCDQSIGARFDCPIAPRCVMGPEFSKSLAGAVLLTYLAAGLTVGVKA